jgi:hypothetical protein
MNTKYIPIRSETYRPIRRETNSEALPVDPGLLERANWWFDVSWYGLLWSGGVTAFAAFATVTFLFLQYWSSGIREKGRAVCSNPTYPVLARHLRERRDNLLATTSLLEARRVPAAA